MKPPQSISAKYAPLLSHINQPQRNRCYRVWGRHTQKPLICLILLISARANSFVWKLGHPFCVMSHLTRTSCAPCWVSRHFFIMWFLLRFVKLILPIITFRWTEPDDCQVPSSHQIKAMSRLFTGYFGSEPKSKSPNLTLTWHVTSRQSQCALKVKAVVTVCKNSVWKLQKYNSFPLVSTDGCICGAGTACHVMCALSSLDTCSFWHLHIFHLLRFCLINCHGSWHASAIFNLPKPELNFFIPPCHLG